MAGLIAQGLPGSLDGLGLVQPPFDFETEPFVTSTVTLDTDRLRASFSWLAACIQEQHEILLEQSNRLAALEAAVDLSGQQTDRGVPADKDSSPATRGDGDSDEPASPSQPATTSRVSTVSRATLAATFPQGRNLASMAGDALGKSWGMRSFSQAQTGQDTIGEEVLQMQVNALKQEVGSLPRKADLLETLSNEVRERVKSSSEMLKGELAIAMTDLSGQVVRITEDFNNRFQHIEAREEALESRAEDLETREKALEIRANSKEAPFKRSDFNEALNREDVPAGADVAAGVTSAAGEGSPSGASGTRKQRSAGRAATDASEGALDDSAAARLDELAEELEAEAEARGHLEQAMEAMHETFAGEFTQLRKELSSLGINVSPASTMTPLQIRARQDGLSPPRSARSQSPQSPNSRTGPLSARGEGLRARVDRLEEAVSELQGHPVPGTAASTVGKESLRTRPATMDRDLPVSMFESEQDGNQARELLTAGSADEADGVDAQPGSEVAGSNIDPDEPIGEEEGSTRASTARAPRGLAGQALGDAAELEKRVRALEDFNQRKAIGFQDVGEPMSWDDVRNELERLRKLFDFVQGVLPKEQAEAMRFFNQGGPADGDHVARTLGPAVELERHKTRLEEEVGGQISKVRHEFENLQHIIKAQQKEVSQADDKLGDLAHRVTRLEGGSVDIRQTGIALSQLPQVPRAQPFPKEDMSHLLDPEVKEGNTPLPYVSKQIMQHALDGLREDIRTWIEYIHTNLLNAMERKADSEHLADLASKIQQAAAMAGDSLALFTKRSLVHEGRCVACDNPIKPSSVQSNKKSQVPIVLTGQWPSNRTSGARWHIPDPSMRRSDGFADGAKNMQQKLPRISDSRKEFPKGKVLRKEQSDPALRAASAGEALPTTPKSPE